MMEIGLRTYGGVENYVERPQPVEPLDYWSDHISISRAAYMEISDMRDEYQHMYEDLFKKYKEVIEREEKLQVELKKEKQHVKTFENEQKASQQRITELEELVKLKEEENKQLFTKSVVQFMIKAAVAQPQKEVEKQKAAFHNLFVQKEILKRKHAQFVKERIQTDEKMKQLDEKVKSLEENKIESDREKKLLIVQRDAYKQDVDDLQKKLKSEKFHYEKLYLQELACRQEISKLQEENTELRSKIEVVKTEWVAEIAKQKLTIDSLFNQKELFKNENAKLKNERSQANEKISQLEDNVKRLEQNLIETTREKNALVTQCNLYKEEVDDLKKKLKFEEFQYEKLYSQELFGRQKITKLQEGNAEIRSKIDKADKEIKSLKHGIEMVKCENDQLRTQIGNVENEKFKINELLENEKKMPILIQNEMKVLKQHNKELIADEQQYKEEIRSLDADLADANNAISKLESDLQVQDEARNEMEFENGKLKKLIDEIDQSLQEAKQYLPKRSCLVKLFRKKSLLNECIQQMEDNIINLQ